MDIEVEAPLQKCKIFRVCCSSKQRKALSCSYPVNEFQSWTKAGERCVGWEAMTLTGVVGLSDD